MFASAADDDKAVKAAEEIKKYCIQTGCLYCYFMKEIGDDMICRICHPREWEVYKNE